MTTAPTTLAGMVESAGGELNPRISAETMRTTPKTAQAQASGPRWRAPSETEVPAGGGSVDAKRD
jgi:hypothetical protein